MTVRIFRCAAAAVTFLAAGCAGLPQTELPATAGDLELAEGLAELERVSEMSPQLEFSHGVPVFVTADVATPSGLADDPVAQALNYLSELQALYRFEDPATELYVDRVVSSRLGTHVHFAQRYRDLPVFGSALGVHIVGGRIRGTLGRYRASEVLPLVSTLTAAEAESAALRQLGDSEVVGDTRLGYFDPVLFGEQPGPVRLVWSVNVSERRPDSELSTRHGLMIDAVNGELLWQWRYGPTQLFTIYDAVVNSTTAWFTESGPTANYPGGGSAFPGSDVDGDAAFINLPLVWDYFENRFGWAGLDGTGLAPVQLVVHASAGARLLEACGEYREPLILLDDGCVTRPIIAHEYTHGVITATSNIAGFTEASTLDEAYANFFEVVNGGDWAIRPGAPTHIEDFEAPRIRSDGHPNEGIPLTAFRLLTLGGVGRPGEAIQVNGLGVNKVETLNFLVMTTLLTLSSRLVDGYYASLFAGSLLSVIPGTGFSLADTCDITNAFAAVGLAQADRDCDSRPDEAQPDTDGDLIPDTIDNCMTIENIAQEDADFDGIGDVCDDSDADGIVDADDNCPAIANATQADGDRDGRGDPCDDEDGDGVIDVEDNCPRNSNWGQLDADLDGVGDACDNDNDNDGYYDTNDNCPFVANTNQLDADNDSIGNACDNCQMVPNSDQTDWDRDRIGDVCDDDDDNDSVADSDDNCPRQANRDQRDMDGDGLGFSCDLDEQRRFYGGLTEVEYANTLINFDPRAEQVRIPVLPCDPRQCPGGIPADFIVTISLDLDTATAARVRDDRGVVVASSSPRDAIELRFRASPAAYFVPSRAVRRSEGATLAFTGRRYYLEIDNPSPGDEPVRINAAVKILGRSSIEAFEQR